MSASRPSRLGQRLSIVAAVTLSVGAAGLGGYNLASADVSSGDRPVYIPINPCRLLDTRAAVSVGPLARPVGSETITVQAHGANGECVDASAIPDDAVALSMNVTALGATERSFLTFWGAGPNPGTANLNPDPSNPPIPNSVNTPLSRDGTFEMYNDRGTVEVVIDVNGFYVNHDHDDRYYTQTESDGRYLTPIAADGRYLTPAQAENTYLTVDDANRGFYSEDEADDRFLTPRAADDRYLTQTRADGRYLTPGQAGATYLTVDDANRSFYSEDEADDRFLTTNEGDDRYLTQTRADGRYLTPGQAGATYLTPEDARRDFYTEVEADDRFLTTNEGDDRYLTQTRADGRYLTPGQAGATYLTQEDADRNYYTQDEADGRFLTPNAGDGRYLTPAAGDAAFLTPAEGNAAYLTPAEGDAAYLTPAEGDVAYVSNDALGGANFVVTGEVRGAVGQNFVLDPSLYTAPPGVSIVVDKGNDAGVYEVTVRDFDGEPNAFIQLTAILDDTPGAGSSARACSLGTVDAGGDRLTFTVGCVGEDDVTNGDMVDEDSDFHFLLIGTTS